jgi:hypothetical protein
MKTLIEILLPISLLLVSCSPSVATPTVEALMVQYTPATSPWLGSLYNCARNNILMVDPRGADYLDSQTADLMIRFGQPVNLNSLAYQIGSDDLLVIANSQHSPQQLNSTQVYRVFSGQINTWKDIDGSNSAIQVWVFPASEDIQRIFDQAVMNGSPVTSTARLASTPGEMTEAITKDMNAIGIINRRLMPVGTRDIFKVTKIPVLALTGSKPSVEISNLISCLQR